MPRQYLPLAICLIAYLLSSNRSDYDLSLISAAFTELGDTLATILVIRNYSIRASDGSLLKELK